MKILVLNAGSSSLKFNLFEADRENIAAKGIVERIGTDPGIEIETAAGYSDERKIDIADHREALSVVCEELVHPEHGVLGSLEEVEAVGHRVVHGGEKVSDSVKVTEEVKNSIRECCQLAPLHNPPNLAGIEACEQVFPNVSNVAVFDTAFHQSMPASSYLYAIPNEYYEKYGIRKYGFHGTSHKYVAHTAAEYLGTSLDDLKLITCHLGNGCSVCAVDRGHVVDTSMGLTPLAGLVMGTRCGDIDPGVVLYFINQGYSVEEVDRILNKESGLFGLAGIGSNDMRDILAAESEGNQHAHAAVELFAHRLQLYIGAYNTLLENADAVVFTGGIGENSVPARKRVMQRLHPLGCYLDEQANEIMGEAVTLSTPESSLKAVVIPTNEELMIARDTRRIVSGK